MQDFITFLGQHPFLTAGIASVVFLLLIVEFIRMKKTMGGLSPQAAIQLINHEHAMVIDIRDTASFKKGHIVHAHNMTPEAVTSDKKMDKMKNKPLIIVCYAGVSSNGVVHQLNKKGFKAHNLQGGMKAWYDAKLPTVVETNHA